MNGTHSKRKLMALSGLQRESICSKPMKMGTKLALLAASERQRQWQETTAPAGSSTTCANNFTSDKDWGPALKPLGSGW
jgi:hypothetical protein